MTGFPPPFAAPPDVVLVASDLHLGEGRDPFTGTYALRENFFADEAFGRWLAYHRADAQTGAMLVLNGDSFDFLRIVRAPETNDDYAFWRGRLTDRPERAAPESVTPRERTFGLQTDGYKAVWKLHVVFTGHPEVFDALAEWIHAGGRVVLVKGNHDLELHWAEALHALRGELGARVKRLGGDPGTVERVAVVEDSFVLENLHVEHGHRYEALTEVMGPAELPGAPGQLNLPLGSFINRYLINALERLDPLLDNVRPVTQSLMALIRRHPIAAWSAYGRAWRFVWRALRVRKRWSSVLPIAAVLSGLVAPPLALVLLALSVVRPDLVSWIPRIVRVGGSIVGALTPVLLPYLLGLLRELGREIGLFRRGHERVDEETRKVLRDQFGDVPPFPTVYAVMGHTHEQTVRRLAERALYVNTGTWIALWPGDRRDLLGRVRYSYARFKRIGKAGYRHEALVWDDQAGAPRAAQLMAGPG